MANVLILSLAEIKLRTKLKTKAEIKLKTKPKAEIKLKTKPKAEIKLKTKPKPEAEIKLYVYVPWDVVRHLDLRSRFCVFVRVRVPVGAWDVLRHRAIHNTSETHK
eukprot:355580-Amorphochlora_amoeboformis.AAC.1